MEYDFNNPQILNGYLEQAMKKRSFNPQIQERINVGQRGGLIYRLFENYYGLFPLDFRAANLKEFNVVGQYFEDVSSYVDKAEHHSNKFGFNRIHMVDRVIKEGIGEEVFIYGVGIGSANIDSIERLEKFIQMVQKVQPSLNKAYEALKKSIPKNLR